MANFAEYDPAPGESRWVADGETAVRSVISLIAEAVIVFRDADNLPHPSIHERADALRRLLNALTEAQEPIEQVLHDGFIMAAEMERNGKQREE